MQVFLHCYFPICKGTKNKKNGIKKLFSGYRAGMIFRIA
jgi:hypothetical protein